MKYCTVLLLTSINGALGTKFVEDSQAITALAEEKIQADAQTQEALIENDEAQDDDFEDVEEADNTEEDDGVMNLAETELNDADFADSDQEENLDEFDENGEPAAQIEEQENNIQSIAQVEGKPKSPAKAAVKSVLVKQMIQKAKAKAIAAAKKQGLSKKAAAAKVKAAVKAAKKAVKAAAKKAASKAKAAGKSKKAIKAAAKKAALKAAKKAVKNAGKSQQKKKAVTKKDLKKQFKTEQQAKNKAAENQGLSRVQFDEVVQKVGSRWLGAIDKHEPYIANEFYSQMRDAVHEINQQQVRAGVFGERSTEDDWLTTIVQSNKKMLAEIPPKSKVNQWARFY